MEQNGKDDLKTQFATREGTYRLMTLSEYSRPNRVGYQTNQSNPQVRVSLVSLPSIQTNAACALPAFALPQQSSSAHSSNASSASTFAGTGVELVNSPSFLTASSSNGGHDALQQQHQHNLSSPTANSSSSSQQQLLGASGGPTGGDRICFNFGKELYVYAYRGCQKLSADLSKPVDKKLYKGTNPSCHDFNGTVAQPDGAPLLVGFTTGQIQLVQPGKREPGRLYNEERFIDKTKVTCLKWLPRSSNLFLAAHASGHLYVYNDELPCVASTPNYQSFKAGDGFTVYTCKSKQARNPLFRWTFTGSAASNGSSINELAFSPCGIMLAIVSQDGFLRVFNYEKMELLGVARSYFGGFLCVCWSPDGKYIVVGGEDDLVTVWSLHERRVVARGQGHRSWVSVVAFDPYTSYSHWDGPDFSDDENPANDGVGTYRCYTADADDPTATHASSATTQLRDHGDERFRPQRPMSSSSTIPDKISTSYRLGSVSQDTQLCLWDITEDVLRQSHDIRRHRLSSNDATPIGRLANGDVSMQSNAAAGDMTDSAQLFASSQPSHCAESNASSSSSSTKLPNNSANHTFFNRSARGKDASAEAKSSNKLLNNSTASSAVGGGLLALNSLTQRLSNFSFGGDSKKSSCPADGPMPPKKSFTFSKGGSASSKNHSASSSTAASSSAYKDAALNTSRTSSSSKTTSTTGSTLVPSSSSTSIVPSYDPMQLIGTPVCPRFDECPLLEPLVCKKIAHERLTALIFREDCFLTACQDGLVYTWARPGFSSVD